MDLGLDQGLSSDEEFYDCPETLGNLARISAKNLASNGSNQSDTNPVVSSDEGTELEQKNGQELMSSSSQKKETQRSIHEEQTTENGASCRDGDGVGDENVTGLPINHSAVYSNAKTPDECNIENAVMSDFGTKAATLDESLEPTGIHGTYPPANSDNSTPPSQDEAGAAAAFPEEGAEADTANDGDSSESSSEEELTEDEVEERKTQAKEHKDRGNELFKSGEYTEAEKIYTEGLKICPKCLKKERSIFFSNRSACLMKLDRTEDAIKDCTEAVKLHPTYLKAVLRRAQLYEKLEKFEEAQKDYETVLEMDPSVHSARAALLHLPEKIEERNEKLKKQMMSSLKDLGNLFLRPFGLSTDNFQMQQDPNTGSYNVQFNNSPGNNGPNGPKT